MDAYWDPSKALAHHQLLELVLSADKDERMLAATMYDLSEDLVDILGRDTEFSIVEAAMLQRAASEQILQASIDRFPELRGQVSLHDNAPLSVMGEKPCAYVTEEQVGRFLLSKRATPAQSAALMEVVERASRTHDATTSLDDAWRVASSAG